MKEERWWCRYCNSIYVSPMPITGVRCGKGHRMKKITNDRELTQNRVAEGMAP
jgi:hypothetical protein